MNINAVVILPVLNKSEDLANFCQQILDQQQFAPFFNLKILLVNTNSENINLQNLSAHQILTTTNLDPEPESPFLTGIKYVKNKLPGHVVILMNPELGHKPDDIPKILDQIVNGYDLVIGSDFSNHKLKRKIINFFARYIGGLGSIDDVTSGFYAITPRILQHINLDNLVSESQAFQLELVYRAKQQMAFICQIFLEFDHHQLNQTKLTNLDVFEFCLISLWIRLRAWTKWLVNLFLIVTFLLALGFIFWATFYGITNWNLRIFSLIITGISLVYLTQSLFNMYLMIYGWEDANQTAIQGVPKKYKSPQINFSLVVPAKDEAKVIGHTLTAISQINYPIDKFQVLVVCPGGDHGTVNAVNKFLQKNPNLPFEIVTFIDQPVNKPHGLNVALKKATVDVVGIFDAEDQPHPDILQIINTTFINQGVDIVQSGVQLINYDSHWFSTLNVLEYFFWFKSSLHFFAKQRVIPLGGNTVFFKRSWLEAFGGWDETSLTEDADIGLRMSTNGARTAVVYDEKYVTREETPDTVTSFIKQRTRWNQGFIQVLLKGEWLQLPSLTQKILAFYVLIVPEIQALGFVIIPFAVFFALYLKLPTPIALLTILPLFLLIFQMVIYNLGMWEFTKKFGFKYSPWLIGKIILTYFPFQFLLGLSALRGLWRYAIGQFNWEKTEHVNAHRQIASTESKTQENISENHMTFNKYLWQRN